MPGDAPGMGLARASGRARPTCDDRADALMPGRPRATLLRLRGRPIQATSPPSAVRRRDRATPLNVEGKGPLISTPGLTLGMVVIARDESRHLPEWLAFH